MSKQIPLTQGKFATVDDADYEWLNQWKWTYLRSSNPRNTGYARRWVNQDGQRKTLNMHRFILDAPENMLVDHRDHDGLNNQRCNLRLATAGENNQNARAHSDGVSKYRGVHYCKTRCLWVATINHDSKPKTLGYFETEIAAAIAYNQSAIHLHGDFALLNNLENHQEPDVLIIPKKPFVPNTSSIRGVYFAKDRNKWRASINIDGQKIILGTFPTEQEAADAYEKANMLRPK